MGVWLFSFCRVKKCRVKKCPVTVVHSSTTKPTEQRISHFNGFTWHTRTCIILQITPTIMEAAEKNTELLPFFPVFVSKGVRGQRSNDKGEQ